MGKYKFELTFLFFLIFVQAFAQTQYSNLPTLHITTVNNQEITSKTNYVQGNLVIKSLVPLEELSMATEIRLRGNSTFRMDKKPYRIKLESKTRILNLPAQERSWVLLANYADKTLIRNALAFKIGDFLGFDFTPSVRFVDVVINGTYMGNYMLTDQMNVGKNRININEQNANDTTEPNITGGYLLEQAGDPSDEPVWFHTSKGLKLVVKSPDSDIINQQQINYIKNYIDRFETRLFSYGFNDPVNGYRAMVDTVSIVNWYIACELTGNPDSFWSVYMYKKRSDDKLYFGPLWDYDIAFNNDMRLGDAVNSLMREVAWDPKAWINQLWLDEWFRKAVWERWQQLIADNLLEELITYIDETGQLINESQQLNFNKWNILSTRVYLETFIFNTYQEGIDYLKSYMTNRIDFLNESFKKIEEEKPIEPFSPSDGYYTIQNKRSMNLIVPDNNSVSANARLVMWEPLEDNDAQLWSISPVGGNLFQIINKNSGLAMTGDGHANNLIQTPVNSANEAQLWFITPVQTGGYGIVNKKSGYSINNSGGGMTNGTNAIEYTNNIHGSLNQQFYFKDMSSVSIQPDVFFSQIEIYPNPARDFVQVKLEAADANEVVITITDLQGIQQYKTSNILTYSGNHTFTIPVSHLTAGIYLVSVYNSNSEKFARKLILVK